MSIFACLCLLYFYCTSKSVQAAPVAANRVRIFFPLQHYLMLLHAFFFCHLIVAWKLHYSSRVEQSRAEQSTTSVVIFRLLVHTFFIRNLIKYNETIHPAKKTPPQAAHRPKHSLTEQIICHYVSKYYGPLDVNCVVCIKNILFIKFFLLTTRKFMFFCIKLEIY